MKIANRLKTGFTLIELLVVISIIGILAGILLPALTKAKLAAKIAQTKTEIQGLKASIEQYYSTYQRYPTSQGVRKEGVTAANPDYTYGTYGVTAPNNPAYSSDKRVKLAQIPVSSSYTKFPTNNSEVVAILMNRDRSTKPNPPNPENRQGQVFLNAKFTNSKAAPGVNDDDGVYRDPWGSPYIITMDLNYDNSCRDAFYRTPSVAIDPRTPGKGMNGLVMTERDAWELRTGVMVWSLGPDKKADETQSATKAPNKDNITSW